MARTVMQCLGSLGSALVLFVPVFSSSPARAQTAEQLDALGASRGQVVFIENVGQFDSRVRFQIRGGNKVAWLTDRGLVFDVVRPKLNQKTLIPSAAQLRPVSMTENTSVRARTNTTAEDPTFDRFVFAEEFANGGVCSAVESGGREEGVYNYFLGPDASTWRTNVRAFRGVICRDVWPGVDLRLFAKGSDIEQEFVVRTGGSPDRVQIAWRGVSGINLLRDGSLEVRTKFGTLRETKAQVYQEADGQRVPVDGAFRLTGANSYAFRIGRQRGKGDLVIDPTLLYSTFLGGSSSLNTMYGMTVDGSGSVYVTGSTTSMDCNSSAPYLKVSGTSKGYSKKSLRIFTLDLALWNKTWQAG